MAVEPLGNPKFVKPPISIFDVATDFFDSCRLLSNGDFNSRIRSEIEHETAGVNEKDHKSDAEVDEFKTLGNRWSCSTCGLEFESLQEQRTHFKSDLHRLNVKLTIIGKDTIKEDHFYEIKSDTLHEDFDVSSISGSDDEVDESFEDGGNFEKSRSKNINKKLFIHLRSGDLVSIWKCLLLNDFEELINDQNKSISEDDGGSISYLSLEDVLGRLRQLNCEPRSKQYLRTILLVSGGHFAGCVFDGNSIVAHKTFHRYVVRAKSGKKQSVKDGAGKIAHSAGSTLRRKNEVALKKEIQDLLLAWKPYLNASSSIFIHAPSKNRQLLLDGNITNSHFHTHDIRNVPLTVRRPTFKEAKRIYNLLTQVVYEVEEKESYSQGKENLLQCEKDVEKISQMHSEKHVRDQTANNQSFNRSSGQKSYDVLDESKDILSFENLTTPLHEASKSGNAQRTLELLDLGMDPCAKDARGRTPYALATEKEVRNTFRRFMALNLEKWDWHAAKVPSPLTKEMEDAQAAKQVEKDSKRKAKAKELKKLRKAKQKAQAEASLAQNSCSTSQSHKSVPLSIAQEEMQRGHVEEREKRAAAAERRIAAMNALKTIGTVGTNAVIPTDSSDLKCSCCMTSLAGKVPFHRYHYHYCTSSCMHVHREMLENENRYFMLKP